MTFQLHPLKLQDFPKLISQAIPGDDLVGQPTPLCCTVTNPQEAQSRAAFHFASQKARLLGDPTVRYLKVTDPSHENTIISVARWHFYPNGYNFETEGHWEPLILSPGDGVPVGFNVPLHNHILTTRDLVRGSWIPRGKPCWILMHLVTLPSYRGKGAAGMLIKWGIEQAEKDHVPAYLEAGAMGRPIYERYGFTQVGELLEVDCTGYAVDMRLVMCKMVYYPQRTGTDDGVETIIM